MICVLDVDWEKPLLPKMVSTERETENCLIYAEKNLWSKARAHSPYMIQLGHGSYFRTGANAGYDIESPLDFILGGSCPADRPALLTSGLERDDMWRDTMFRAASALSNFTLVAVARFMSHREKLRPVTSAILKA